MFIIIVFGYVLTRSPPVSKQDFYFSPPWDQSRDVTPRLGFFVILQCTSFSVCIFILATIITSMQKLTNWCAEALVAYRNSLLNRLSIVQGVKILTIIIIIIIESICIF